MASLKDKPEKKDKSRKAGTKKPTANDKKAIIIRKIHSDPTHFVKFAWNEVAQRHIGSLISAKAGTKLLVDQHKPECRPSDVDGKKFYCYFDEQHNEPVCILVDDDDPRCA